MIRRHQNRHFTISMKIRICIINQISTIREVGFEIIGPRKLRAKMKRNALLWTKSGSNVPRTPPDLSNKPNVVGVRPEISLTRTIEGAARSRQKSVSAKYADGDSISHRRKWCKKWEEEITPCPHRPSLWKSRMDAKEWRKSWNAHRSDVQSETSSQILDFWNRLAV